MGWEVTNDIVSYFKYKCSQIHFFRTFLFRMVASDIQASRMSKYSDKKENASRLCKGYPVPEKKRKRKVYLETTPFVTYQPCSWQITSYTNGVKILPSISVVICKYVRWMKGSHIYIYIYIHSYIVDKL